MYQTDKDSFLDVMEGIPSRFLARALNTCRTGSDWTGCSKKLMHEFLFSDTHSHDITNMPSLYELRDLALRLQEASKETMIKLKKMKEVRDEHRAKAELLKISMTIPQKNEVSRLIEKGFRITGVAVVMSFENTKLGVDGRGISGNLVIS